MERLRVGGAEDIRRSTRQEWVTFRAPSGRFVQLYWWQLAGQYICGAYDEDSGVMTLIGWFAELEGAGACALSG